MTEPLIAAVSDLTTAIEQARVETAAVRDELQEERARSRRVALLAVGTTIALILSLAVGVVGWVNQRGETARVRRVVSTDCPALRDFATYDIPGSSGELARLIVRDYYRAYNSRCVGVTGSLPPIDPDATLPAPTTPPAGSR